MNLIRYHYLLEKSITSQLSNLVLKRVYFVEDHLRSFVV